MNEKEYYNLIKPYGRCYADDFEPSRYIKSYFI